MSGFSNMAISFTIISILSGCLTVYSVRSSPRRPAGHELGLAVRRRHRHLRRPVDGRDLLGVPHGRRPVLLGGQAARPARARPSGRGSPAGSTCSGRWPSRPASASVARCRSRPSSPKPAATTFWTRRYAHHRHPGRHPLHPGPAEHLQRPPGRPAQRRLGLVASRSAWRSSSSSCSWRRIRTRTSRRRSCSAAQGWNAFKGLSGYTLPFYVFLIGMLNAQYTFTGYDASAHVSEETMQAQPSGPKGIVQSIWLSLIAGFILLVGVSFALPSHFPLSFAGTDFKSLQRHRELNLRAVGGRPSAAAGRVGRSSLFLIVIVIVAQFFCGMSSITANSRMIFAFSRDGAVPFHKFWHHVSPKRRVRRCARSGSAPSGRSSCPSGTSGAPWPTSPWSRSRSSASTSPT